MKWEKVKLGSVLEKIIGGGTPSKNNFEYWNGDVNWASVKDFQDGHYRLNYTVDKISELGLKNSSANLIPVNTVITPTRMGLGRVCMSKIETSINQDLKALIPNKEKIENNYLLYVLIDKRQEIEAIGRGATVKGITLDMLKNLEINLPSIEIQTKIANVLSKYDDLIENNLKRIELLEEAAQRLYKEWFIDLRFPGHEKVQIVDGIPEGWEKKNYNALFPVVTGKKNANISTSNGKYPFFTCSQEILYTDNFSFEGNAILLAGNGEFNVKYYRGQFEAYQRTYVLIPYKEELFFFIYQHIKINLNKIVNASKGAVIKYLTKDMIENTEIVIPKNELLDYYNKISKKYFYQIENLKTQNQKLTEARDRLLPKLMKGEIEI